jgi:hypothetical protein
MVKTELESFDKASVNYKMASVSTGQLSRIGLFNKQLVWVV